MEVADQNHQWFKFLLRHQGGRYTRLEHIVYTEQKFIKRDRQGNRIDAKLHTCRLPLDSRVESIFYGKFLCEENPVFHVLMWKDVSVLICILPSLLKIHIHHVITFMMMKTAMDSIVPAVESTLTIKKSTSVAMHVIHTIENMLLFMKAVVGRSLSLLFVYG